MSDLFIWLPDNPEGSWTWHSPGDAQGVAVTEAEKTSLGSRVDDKVYVIISGQSVRIFNHELPKIRESERLAAAGFTIEDQIAAPVADQHLTLAAGDDNRLAVMASDKMDQVVSALSEFGLTCDGIYADFDMMKHHEGTTHLGDRVVHPGEFGYTLDPDWGEVDAEPAHIPNLTSALDLNGSINLLSGPYARRGQNWLSGGHLPRLAAMVLVVGLAWLGLLYTQGRAVNLQADHMREEARQLYTAQTGRPAPSNPALAVTRAVKDNGTTSANFLTLSHTLFEAIESVEGITLDTLQFDASRNQLNVRLVYPQFESATELEAAVKTLGGIFRPGGVREQGGRLLGDAAVLPGGRT